MIWANSLGGKARYHAWQALVKSRFNYGIPSLLDQHKKLREVYRRFMYRSLCALLKVKAKVGIERIFQHCMDTESDAYLDLLAQHTRNQINKGNPTQNDGSQWPQERNNGDSSKRMAEINKRMKVICSQDNLLTSHLLLGTYIPKYFKKQRLHCACP